MLAVEVIVSLAIRLHIKSLCFGFALIAAASLAAGALTLNLNTATAQSSGGSGTGSGSGMQTGSGSGLTPNDPIIASLGVLNIGVELATSGSLQGIGLLY